MNKLIFIGILLALITAGLCGCIVIFYGPIENDFSVNLLITGPREKEEGDTLESGADQLLEAYPTLYTNYSLISRGERSVNDLPGYEIVQCFNQGLLHIKGKQVLVEKNDLLYILTYSALLETYNTLIH